jgi:hypothetical protein
MYHRQKLLELIHFKTDYEALLRCMQECNSRSSFRWVTQTGTGQFSIQLHSTNSSIEGRHYISLCIEQEF